MCIRDRLLSQMGSIRHISGAKSELGMRLADQMNSLRQHLEKDRKLEAEVANNSDKKNIEQESEFVGTPWE